MQGIYPGQFLHLAGPCATAPLAHPTAFLKFGHCVMGVDQSYMLLNAISYPQSTVLDVRNLNEAQEELDETPERFSS